ncbi:hypothetical protein HK101_001941 [Irineochytrium annulatum]|nr:hypothetical protein HK101_001941 [Irineochytrium annulatum]
MALASTLVDDAPPHIPRHLSMRLKKLQGEDERCDEIHRKNLILLERMRRQMEAPKGFSNLDRREKVGKVESKPAPGARRRREELEQIAMNNLMLMQRVEAREPNYNQERWRKDRKTNLGYLQRITKFPETYAPILAKEGVDPPFVGAAATVRENRVTALRRSYATPHDASERPSSSSLTSAAGSASRPPMLEAKNTRTVELRRMYISRVAGGGEEGYKRWFRDLSIGTASNDPLDVGNRRCTEITRLAGGNVSRGVKA